MVVMGEEHQRWVRRWLHQNYPSRASLLEHP